MSADDALVIEQAVLSFVDQREHDGVGSRLLQREHAADAVAEVAAEELEPSAAHRCTAFCRGDGGASSTNMAAWCRQCSWPFVGSPQARGSPVGPHVMARQRSGFLRVTPPPSTSAYPANLRGEPLRRVCAFSRARSKDGREKRSTGFLRYCSRDRRSRNRCLVGRRSGNGT